LTWTGTAFAGFPAEVASDSPVGYWRLGESSGTTANDETANSNDGQYLNSPILGYTGPVEDANYSALGLDGVDDHVKISNASSLNPTSAITLEAWVKPASGSFSTVKPIVVKSYTSHNPPYYQYGLFLYDSGTSKLIRFVVATGGSFSPVDITTPWTYGSWQHIAGTWDGTTARVYLNGNQVGSATRTGSLPAYASPIDFGCFENLPKSSTYCFRGGIDEVAVYSTALSTTRIAAHYAARGTPPTVPPPSSAYGKAVVADSPVAYWRLGEASGSTLRDQRELYDGSYASPGPQLGQTGAIRGESNSAARFSGQLASIPYDAALNPNPAGGLSVEAWVLFDQLGTDYQAIVSSRLTAGGYKGWTLYYNGAANRFEFWHGGGSDWTLVRGSTPAQTGRWYHLVGTLNGGQLALYLNGDPEPVSYSQGSGTYSSNTTGSTLIGAARGTNGTIMYHLNGKADEVALYASALPPDRIRAHYEGGIGGELASRFRPILRFNAGEDWRPLNVETFLAEEVSGEPTHTVCRTKSNPGYQCTWMSDWTALWSYDNGPTNPVDTDEWPYIDVYDDPEAEGIDVWHTPVLDPSCDRDEPLNDRTLLDCDTGAQYTSMYWHAVGPFAESDYIYLDYWTLYRYNAAVNFDHEGDWESVIVAVPADDQDPDTFAFAAFSAHGHLWHYLRPTLICDAAETEGSCGGTSERVQAFVADGSHASYPQPCADAIPWCDQTEASGEAETPEKEFGGEVFWGANDDADALRAFPTPRGWSSSVAEPTWVDWPGWWGVDFRVESPGVRAEFDRPDLEIACTERYTDASLNCGSEGPSGLLNSSMRELEGGAPGYREVRNPCDLWRGPFIVTSVCDPSQLIRAYRAGTLQRQGGLSARGSALQERTFVSGRGISQLAGRPLRAGEQLTLTGRIRPSAEITVRFALSRGLFSAKFTGIAGTRGGEYQIALPTGGRIRSLGLLAEDGRVIRPKAIQRVESSRRSP
jgi:hypothetical protein